MPASVRSSCSTDDELRHYVGDLPFAVIGDPAKARYAEFGIGSSPRAVLDPRAMPGNSARRSR